MLTVTVPALERLSRRLARKGADEDEALRFTRGDKGWLLRLDHACQGDTAIRHSGRTVLLLDETVSEAMSNMTLDTRKSGQGVRLRLYRNRGKGE